MEKSLRKIRRQKRTRSKVQGSKNAPRISVHRTNKYIYAQLIDDGKKETILTVSERHMKTDGKGTKTERAKNLGMLLAEKAKEKKIKKAVFDRGSYAYHGRVKAVAEGAREAGLQF